MSRIRRDRVVEIVTAASDPVTGTELANLLGVSRQVVVQDVAILRAEGSSILSTPRGYFVPRFDSRSSASREIIAVRHDRDQIEIELTTLIDLGIRVIDVAVEHPVYGELRGLLMISSRSDIRAFLERLEGSEPLLALTRGVHLHTIEAGTAQTLQTGRSALRELGILLEQ